MDESAAAEQRESLRRVRESRDVLRVEGALRGVDEACRGRYNLLEPILEAVDAGATLGEISACWTRAWGRHRETFA